MSMHICEKLKLIRSTEGMTRPQFFDETGIAPDTMKNWETRKSNSVASDKLELIAKSKKFKKYALWLITDQISPEIGQIAPCESAKTIGPGTPKSTLTSAFERTIVTSISLGWLTPKSDINFGMLSDVFLADFEAVGGQVTKNEPLELAQTGTASKT